MLHADLFLVRMTEELTVDVPLIATGETGCETDHVYESVICFGRARVVSDLDERVRIARLFVQKYVDQAMPDRSLKAGLVFMDIVDFITFGISLMTGKRLSPP